MQLVGPGAVERQQLVRVGGRERRMRMGAHPQGTRVAMREIDHHAIDAVERGTGHEPDVKRWHVSIVPPPRAAQ